MKPIRTSALRLTAIAFCYVLGSFTLAQIPADTQPAPRISFTTVDVLLDPRGKSLAAYQLEFVADPTKVKLVGIEGGQHKAFEIPPYYDPKALSGNRVILAALNTGNDLPNQKTRVARLHLQVTGDAKPQMSAKLVTAASSNDQVIPADVSVSEGAVQ